MKICVIGLGYVGLPLSVSLADAGFSVLGVDINEKVVEKINKGIPPFFETGLKEAIKRNLGLKFEATSNTEYAMKECDSVFITVGTPNSGSRIDTDTLIKAARNIGRYLRKNQLIIMKSTVPVGFTEDVLKSILEEESGLHGGRDFSLAFVPERILEGRALEEFRTIPKIVSGDNKESIKRVSDIIGKLGGKIVEVSSIKSAEMIKLIDNINRDVSFAFGNEIGLACETLGVDVFEVIQAANQSYPRNEIMVPSIGVGGSCLTKDTFILANQLMENNFKPNLMLLARQINTEMPYHILKKVKQVFQEINRPLKGAKIFILGLAFKGYPETDDIRHSPSEIIIKELKKMNVNVVGYDPKVSVEQAKHLGVEKTSFENGFKEADAIIIATNHPSYSKLDFKKVAKEMKTSPIIIDGWRTINPIYAKKIGFKYKGIGQGII